MIKPKKIPLTQGKYAIVDAEDYQRLSKHKWCAAKMNDTYVAARHSVHLNNKVVYMHRDIMNPPKDMQVDHINDNRLDNRKANLRVCTVSQKQATQKPGINKTSRFKGVFWFKRDKKWLSKIMCNYRRYHLGLFDNEIDAARTYDHKAIELFGEFARPNFPIVETKVS